jgi:hypothetical protein
MSHYVTLKQIHVPEHVHHDGEFSVMYHVMSPLTGSSHAMSHHVTSCHLV